MRKIKLFIRGESSPYNYDGLIELTELNGKYAVQSCTSADSPNDNETAAIIKHLHQMLIRGALQSNRRETGSCLTV